jgi:probable phosphoglycerate mutase
MVVIGAGHIVYAMMTNPTEKTATPKRRRIYLMRHGDVSYFDAAGKPHNPATVPLNDTGREHAQAAAQALAGIPLDRVIASDLPRSTETATIVAAQRCPVESQPDLREIQPGRLADIAPEGAETAFLSAFAGQITRESRFLGGETFGSLEDRVHSFLEKLLRDPGWAHMLIVAHGGVNRVVLTRAIGTGLASFAAFEQEPACINILDVDGAGRWIVRLVNHTPYNPAKHGIELTTMEHLYLQYRAGRG